MCIAVCSVCYNGGTCIAPERCNCTAGWTGNTCNIGNPCINYISTTFHYS